MVDDYPASAATTGVVNIGGTTTGNLETILDNDWFRVILTAGHLYQFDLEGIDTGKGTLVDPTLALLISSGALIAYDYDSGVGGNAQITFAASTSGTYYSGRGMALVEYLGRMPTAAIKTAAKGAFRLL